MNSQPATSSPASRFPMIPKPNLFPTGGGYELLTAAMIEDIVEGILARMAGEVTGMDSDRVNSWDSMSVSFNGKEGEQELAEWDRILHGD